MISKTKLGGILLITTALGGSAALAQSSPGGPAPSAGAVPGADAAADPAVGAAPPVEAEIPEEEVDVSAPGGGSDEIVVVGRRIPNTIRASREVVSVLSQADIARTGEGDIAGALQRVTGLSVVGGRFVYVRGLGERYSLALLNGLPIPSPDPLRRVVPLDLFPTSVLASTVVQKSYSVNFPGEFGGGVINLTTRAVPEEPFLTIGGSIGGSTTTTGQLGLTYQGGGSDIFGFDDGTRSTPALLQAAQASGNQLVVGSNFTLREVQDITASLNNSATSVIQRNEDIPVNFAIEFSAGKAWDAGDNRFGFILAAGWKNNWQTRSGLQQVAFTARRPTPDADPVLTPDLDFRFVSTENRAVINGLFGAGAEIGEHKIRWTNLYVNDTIKEARLLSGFDQINTPDTLQNRQGTAHFRRQLLDTQLVGEFKFDNLSLDVRGTYANSKRLSPYERFTSYAFVTSNSGLVINDFINNLNSNGQFSQIAFSRLNEDVYGGGADLGYKFEGGPFPVRATIGYGYTDNQRTSSRRDYRFRAGTGGAVPIDIAQQRIDFLLSDFNVYTQNVVLEEISGEAGAAEYDAGLRVHAGYGQIEIEPLDGVQFVAGVRYESAKQFVNPIDLFGSGAAFLRPTQLDNDYWLPAATLTWNFAEDMQLRFSASKTIARPQFRELAPQNFLDTDTDRLSFGNQFLIDSQLFNAEARYEYYFGRDQRLTLSGFFKKIDNPIETFLFIDSSALRTSFANAPEAELYGAEVEAIKYIPLDRINDGEFWAGRRLLISANYTYTQSKIKVGADDTTIVPFLGVTRPASEFFRDGQQLTGQSDHIANIQIGFQDQDSLSEQTLLLNYASDRVSVRGSGNTPDFVERPGFRLDLVVRQAMRIQGFEFEVKAEARNLTNTDFQETQQLNGTRVDNNTYKLGRSFQLGVSTTF
jgi:TonB-dependent receptor